MAADIPQKKLRSLPEQHKLFSQQFQHSLEKMMR